MSGLRKWFRYHLIRNHVLVPVWKRVPERRRWDVVYFLNKSQRFAWCDLVDAALSPVGGDDPCDGRLPLPGRDCRNQPCGWGHAHDDHSLCTCYCGKFRVKEAS